MKKRYTGGFAVVIFALGFMLSQFWNFGGFGTGEGKRSGEGEQAADTTDQSSDLSNVLTGGELPSSASATDPTEQNPEYITIVIHDQYYRLTNDADPQAGVDISLSEVVRRVSESTGGEQGVKLRILFEKNAQEGTLADLHAALHEKGVHREAIQEITEYVN